MGRIEDENGGRRESGGDRRIGKGLAMERKIAGACKIRNEKEMFSVGDWREK